MIHHLIISIILLGATVRSSGQTCCSGGVPLSNNIGMPFSASKGLQFNISYDLNVLNILKKGSETIDDASRTRRTHSLLAQASYAISPKFAFDFLFTWVQQERIIRQFGNTNTTLTNGIGDGVILLKYHLLGNPDDSNLLSAGIGIKVPLGASDKKTSGGLPINADLQPGSGAWDVLYWGQFFHSKFFRPTMDLNLTGTYSIKGKNRKYLGEQTYQFGKELQIISSLADRISLGDLIFDPSISLRYRKAWKDLYNNVDLPSTGGDWIFIRPGLTWWPTYRFACQANLDIPIMAKVIGNQLTTTYRFQVGLYFKVETKEIDPEINFIPQ